MEVTIEELMEMLGRKDVEIYLLNKQVKVLSETIERMTPKRPEGEASTDDHRR